MKMMINVKAIWHVSLFAVVLVLLCGCGAITVTDAWQSSGFKRKAMDKVLVVAVTANKTNRILFEKGFSSELADKGIQATASYDVIGGATPTREAVAAWLTRNSDVSYVIVTRYGGMETQKEYVPESVRTYYTGPYYSHYGNYWNHYGSTQTMTREAYVDTKSTVMLTTAIYDVRTEELVWTGRSKAFEVGAVSRAAKELAQRMVRRID